MSKAIITLEDKDEDGQIGLSMFLEGGFQKDSNARQHAAMVLKYLDSIAGMKTEQPVQWVGGTYVPAAEMAAEGGHASAAGNVLQLDGPNGLRLVKG